MSWNEIGEIATGIYKYDFGEGSTATTVSQISGWLEANVGELNSLIFSCFSGANLGYHYELFNKFYTGANGGIIYLPTEGVDVIPQLSAELMYKKSSKNKHFNSVLIRGGVQLPLIEMDYKVIPYLSLSYLIN